MGAGNRDVEVSKAAAASHRKGRLVIAAIGIDKYRHWRPLQNAANDAIGATNLFAQIGFEVVRQPLINQAATRRAIEALVSGALEAQLCAEDSLVVFYAGHGGVRTQRVGDHEVRTGYLVPVDGAASSDGHATWVELEPWINKIARLPAKHILVLLDACFSGSLLSNSVRWGRGDGRLTDIHFLTASSRMSRLLITSALADEPAMDGGPVPGHSLFMGCIVEALTGGAASVARRDGMYLTIGSEIGRYVRNRVQTYPGSPGWRQTPDFGTFAYDDRGEMLIPLLDVRGIGKRASAGLDASASLAVSRVDQLRASNAIRLLESGEHEPSVAALSSPSRHSAATDVARPARHTPTVTRQRPVRDWWERAKASAVALGQRLVSRPTCTHDVHVHLSCGAAHEMPVAPATEPVAYESEEDLITDISATQTLVDEPEREPPARSTQTRALAENDPASSSASTEPTMLLSDIHQLDYSSNH